MDLSTLSLPNPAVLTAGLATAADDPGLPAASPGD
jgi:hypothetical protein